MLFKEGASPAVYSAGLRYAIDKGWLVLHESGTFVRFTQAGVIFSPDPAIREEQPPARGW
jgi:hypothetical protein